MTHSPAAAPSYHHGDLRSALISEALRVVQQDGPTALSLRALARAIGVSATAVYRHFANKDDLLATIACEGFIGLCEAMQAQLASAPNADTRARLVLIGEAYVAYAIAQPGHYRLMFGKRMVERAAYPELAAAAATSYRMLSQSVADAIATDQLPALPISLISTLCWSLVHGLATLHNDQLLTETDLPDTATLGATLTQLLADALGRFKE